MTKSLTITIVDPANAALKVAVGCATGQNNRDVLAEKALEFYKDLSGFLPENAAGAGTKEQASVFFDDDIEEDEDEDEWDEEETEDEDDWDEEETEEDNDLATK